MEVRRHVQARAVVPDQALDRQVQLADQRALRPDGGAHQGDELEHLVAIGRVHRDQRLVGVVALAPRRVGRVVAPPVVLDRLAQRVDAEAVGAVLDPEAQDAEHRLADVRVAPVQIGLLGQVGVVVPGAAPLVPRPCGAAEVAHPVGRRRVRRPLPPEVPLRVLPEPRVLDRGVVRDVVEDQPQPEPMRLLRQRVEVGERAEARVDVAVVGDVVAEVGHRRAVERREPDRVDAEVGEVRKPRTDAGQVARPVAVGVLERAGVDLVDRPAPEPADHR